MTIDPVPEYNVKITVRNNLLLNAIRSAGFKTQSDFARACDISPSALNSLVAMRELPITEDGSFSQCAKTVMEALGAAPSDLWTDRQLTTRLRRNTGEAFVRETDMDHLLESYIQAMTLPDPSEQLEQKELEGGVSDMLMTLTRRESAVLRMRFGLGGTPDFTLEEAGVALNVTRERVRQIESKAIRKLRQKADMEQSAESATEKQNER